MQDKVVVITGATSGIGAIAAEKLAAMGARMLVIARNRTRGEATLKRLREPAPGIDHRVYYADLSLVKEMKRVGDEIAAAERRVDVLVDHAGAVFGKRGLTRERLGRTFAPNHMPHVGVTER